MANFVTIKAGVRSACAGFMARAITAAASTCLMLADYEKRFGCEVAV